MAILVFEEGDHAIAGDAEGEVVGAVGSDDLTTNQVHRITEIGVHALISEVTDLGIGKGLVMSP